MIDIIDQLRLIQGSENSTYANLDTLNFLFSTIQNIDKSVCLLDHEGFVIWTNNTYLELTGFSQSQLIHQQIDSFISKYSKSFCHITTSSDFKKTNQWTGDLIFIKHDGETRLQKTHIFPLVDARGPIDLFVLITSDSEKVSILSDEIDLQTGIDALTYLSNMDVFRLHVESLIAVQMMEFYIIVIDIKNFKEIIQHYSQQASNIILSQLAERISAHWRSYRLSDTLFSILFMIEDDNNIAIEVSKILTMISKPYLVLGDTITVQVRIGVGKFPDNGLTFSHLYENTSNALKKASQNKRDVIIFSSEEENQKSQSSLILKRQLNEGLKRNEFKMYYQPVFNVAEKTIIGAESLMRWNQPNKGMVSPEFFINFAEEIDLSIELGYWSIAQVIRDYEILSKSFGDNFTVSINISEKILLHPDFLKRVSDMMEINNIENGKIMMEISEEIFVRNKNKKILTVLRKLKKLGFLIAADGFGKEIMPLSILKEYPIDIIKIDRSLITESYKNNQNCLMVSSIIAIAKNFNIRSSAIGAETSEDIRFVEESRADFVQGYHYGKAIPLAEFRDTWCKK